MNKLLIMALLAVANLGLALGCALAHGPTALTITFAVTGVFTQLMILGMLVNDSRPSQVPRVDG